jgi:hypothetical protein
VSDPQWRALGFLFVVGWCLAVMVGVALLALRLTGVWR